MAHTPGEIGHLIEYVSPKYKVWHNNHDRKRFTESVSRGPEQALRGNWGFQATPDQTKSDTLIRIRELVSEGISPEVIKHAAGIAIDQAVDLDVLLTVSEQSIHELEV